MFKERSLTMFIDLTWDELTRSWLSISKKKNVLRQLQNVSEWLDDQTHEQIFKSCKIYAKKSRHWIFFALCNLMHWMCILVVVIANNPIKNYWIFCLWVMRYFSSRISLNKSVNFIHKFRTEVLLFLHRPHSNRSLPHRLVNIHKLTLSTWK